MRLAQVLFFLLIIFTFSFAQTVDPALDDSLDSVIPVYKAEPVIINATRSAQSLLHTPYAVERFDINRIQGNQKLVSLDEVLQSVPGLIVNNRNNFALGDRISIRGIGARSSFGVRGIKILLDEIPLTLPDGQSQLNNLDLGSTGKIEIIRGASSALYGNAAGGLISIQTEESSKEAVQLQSQIIFGSHDLLRLQGKLSGRYEKSSYLLNINKFKSIGFRENSAVESWSLNAINRYSYSEKLKITGLINVYNSPYALNPSSLSPEDAKNNRTTSRYFVRQQGSGEKVSQGQAGITFNYQPSTTSQLKVTFYGLGRSLKNPIPSRIIELDRLSAGLRTTYSDENKFGKLKLRWMAGIDSEVQSDKRKEFANEGLPSALVDNIKNAEILKSIEYGQKLQHQDEQVLGYGPFSRLTLHLNDQFLFTLAGRYDQYNFKVNDHFLADSSDDTGNIKMQQLSPMAAITYLFSPTQSLYINYSTAFQTPTTSELGNNPTGLGGLNPNLKPETIRNYEIGIKGIITNFNLFYQAALYYLQINEMLIPYQNQLSEEIFYRNSGQAENAGLELSLNWNIFNSLSWQFSYSYMNFTFTDYKIDDPFSNDGETINLKNNKIPGVTPQKLYSSLLYNHPSGFSGMIQLNWIDAYYTNDFNGPVPGSENPKSNYINKAYSFLNLRLAKTWKFSNLEFDLFGGIDNLLKTRYNGSVIPNARNDNFFEPSPGRTWYGGIKLIL